MSKNRLIDLQVQTHTLDSVSYVELALNVLGAHTQPHPVSTLYSPHNPSCGQLLLLIEYLRQKQDFLLSKYLVFSLKQNSKFLLSYTLYFLICSFHHHHHQEYIVFNCIFCDISSFQFMYFCLIWISLRQIINWMKSLNFITFRK